MVDFLFLFLIEWWPIFNDMLFFFNNSIITTKDSNPRCHGHIRRCQLVGLPLGFLFYCNGKTTQ